MPNNIRQTVSRMLKKILRPISILIIIAFIIINIIIALSNTDFAQVAARNIINALMPGSISWEELSVSPYAGRVRIAGAVLKDADNKIVISIKGLDASVSVPGLMRGELLIHKAELVGPSVDFLLDGNGSLNLLEALGISPGKKKNTGKKASLPEFLTVEKFVLTGGKVRWSQPAAGFHAGIDDIDITAGLSFRERSGDLSLKTGTVFFTRGGRTIRLVELSAAGLMKKGLISPCRIDARSENSWLAIGGELADVFTAIRFDVTSGFSVSLPEMGGLAALPGRISGYVKGSLTVRGPLNNPSAALSCAYGGGEILGSSVDSAYLSARLEDRVVTVPALLARAAGGTCALSCALDLAGAFPDGFLSGNRSPKRASYRVVADLARFPLRAIPLRGVAPRGAINAKASAQGSGLSPASASAEFRASATIDNFSMNESGRPAPFSVVASGMLDRGILRIESLTASLGNLKMSGAGSLERTTGAASASISATSGDISTEAAAFGLNMRGSCAIDAALSGTIRRPAVSLRLSGERLRYRELAFGDASAEVSLDGGHAVAISRFSLANGSSRVSLSGSAPLRRDGPISLDIRTFDIQLADFMGTVGGRVTLAGGVSGSIMAPEGSVRLTATAVDLGFWKFDAAEIGAHAGNGRIYLEPVTLVRAPGETASADGWITTRGAYEFTMQATGISLGAIAPVRATGMDGKLSLDLGGKGSLNDPRLDGHVSIATPGFRDRVFNDFLINVSVANRAITVNGKMNFDLAGYYSFSSKSFNLSLIFDRTDLSPLLSALGNPGLDATVSGSLRARGNSGRPAEIDLSADISELDVSSGGRKLISSSPLAVTVSGGILTLPPARISVLDSGWMNLSGGGSIHTNLVIDSEGVVPVEIANWLGSAIANGSGSIRYRAALRGPLRSPELTAGITFQDAGFDLPAIGNGLRHISGAIHVMPGRIVIAAVNGSMGSGAVGVNGSIGLAGLSIRDADVTLSADRAQISVPDTLDLDFNARLNVAGTPDRALVQGDVTILRGLYYRDLILHPFRNIGVKRTEKADTGGGEKSPLDTIRLNVALINRNPFEIDNNIARLTINNNMQFFGTVTRPVLNGSMRVESGSIFYLGREFVINSGRVDFLNPYRIDPVIEIRGSAAIKSWTVLVGLSGRPDELRFDLTSQPVLESSDILSLVLLGKTKGEKSSFSAGQLVSQAIALTYGDAIKKKTGIDSIEIKTDEEKGKKASGNITATIGKSLNDRVTYYYSIGKDERGLKSSTTIEYKFFDNILVDTEYDSTGKVGAGIRYRRSFR